MKKALLFYFTRTVIPTKEGTKYVLTNTRLKMSNTSSLLCRDDSPHG
jgi:hypothetical protein